MTKEFQRIQFDPRQCRREAEELRTLLTGGTLQERKHVLPFFMQRLQLSAFLGTYNGAIARCDLVAHELPLFGDFVADLVVGDSKSNAFAFFEFEDASPNSIFTKRGAATPVWSPRFERGFSQLVDWFFKLHDQGSTVEFENKFGNRMIRHLGILVIGRSEFLGKREEQRFRWRHDNVLVNSKPIFCKTYDHLCEDILARLDQFPIAAQVESVTNAALDPSGRVK